MQSKESIIALTDWFRLDLPSLLAALASQLVEDAQADEPISDAFDLGEAVQVATVARYTTNYDLALTTAKAFVDNVQFVELLAHSSLFQIALAAFDEPWALRSWLTGCKNKKIHGYQVQG